MSKSQHHISEGNSVSEAPDMQVGICVEESPKKLYDIDEGNKDMRLTSTEYNEDRSAYEVNIEIFDRKSMYEILGEISENYDYFHTDYLYQEGKKKTNNIKGMTKRQQELINLAYREGYFKVPREISQRELADHPETNGSSKSSVSQLLRRGTERMIEEYLDPEAED